MPSSLSLSLLRRLHLHRHRLSLSLSLALTLTLDPKQAWLLFNTFVSLPTGVYDREYPNPRSRVCVTVGTS